MMKRLITGLLLAFLFAFTCQADNLAMVVNQWPPYVEQEVANQGVAVALVKEALGRKGHTVSVQFEPWPRALEGLDVGVYDVVGAAWKTPERDKVLLFSKPYMNNRIMFIKRKEAKIKYETLADLNGYLIGTVKDYAYEDEFVNSRKFLKIPQNRIIQNLQRLVQGDIDLTIGDQMAIEYEIGKFMPNRREELEFLSKPLSLRGLRIGVSRQNANAQKIIADFDAAIDEMKKDGSYQKFLEQLAN